MSTLKIALMGAGLIGREHASLVRSHPATELVGIADVSAEGKQYAESIGVPHYEDFDAMLEELRPNGAIVALPNTMHVMAGLACVRRGIPSLVEKPIADTVEAARELVTESESAGVPILIGHHRRHSPDIREAKRIISAGEIGALVAVNGMWLVDKPHGYFDVEWRRRPGGGPLLINLIHDIDCLRFICGEIESVKAYTSSKVRGFEVEDTGSVILRFENGALGSFVMSDTVVSPYAWDPASGQALYFPHQPENCYFFGGRTASLSVPGMSLWRHAKEGGHWQDPLVRHHVPLDGSRTYVNQLEHFCAVIRRETAPLVTARDGMMTLAATLAIEKAAREDRTVTIAEMIS